LADEEHNTYRLTSLANETIKVGHTEDENNMLITDIKINFRKHGVHPSVEEYLKLAFILNFKVPPSGLKTLDFTSMFKKFHMIRPIDHISLQKIVSETFEWPFFKILETQSVYHNLCRLRSFFQMLTPIGISFVEGNHRGLLAGKVLYGQQILEGFPLTKQLNPGFPLPPLSPLYHTGLQLKVILPVKTEDLITPGALITTGMISICRKESKKIAYFKTLIIEQTWKDFMRSTIELMMQP
jgi:hypothetical protein